MFGFLSDIGISRKLNEDYVGAYEDELKKIYVVADGMGGHNAGEIASKIAVDSTLDYIKNLKEFENLENILCKAIKTANIDIYNKAKVNSSMAGMGTTITACLIVKDRLVIANVGDSSCFIVKRNNITKITKDHSLVQQLVDSGSITEEEAVNHPNKNIITRALGTNEEVKVDLFTMSTEGIFKIILCSDGLTNVVNRHEIYDIIIKNNNDDACTKLVELSKLKGSKDNISVIIFEGECENDRDYTK
ncbi:serine/threonine phosphatase Stp [Clostridium pasteurianum DSM 525 = ATCC 6013]|uniref:Protein serine/threonine phosphatase n=1 Tax=Clostridium pasteurianum DSM 525 = ATCC 6013 TaxID=1262449 RepID=A0A0H3JA17_CLOPA|nr:Stp1/IreP family PP2C-type Ser/Thr phosphatase [Clostridium pasteurianum]AJA48170.1 serine/threonine phosphatase Stp [Clostridium pasteurianum DSM 525 = ATCC 6013]AJA52158.1 serine/threonine phosphatase Stp [Clostridium pasteurianum DSM 525 = ATCC 6013]AOZ75430.1 protein phosphatase [Clostridium pasteurianum DSM 525 = ATCC 6013]AOZ79225.1 protein phosphatase [Clostridium pasteurianum]ELP60678.1 protein phosphatase [Clostridium pasteurianum DSM 525 = ATCC 6013]